MEAIEVLYSLGRGVVDALNAAGVKPPSETTNNEFMGAIMVIVGPTDNSSDPIGGSLNWDKHTQKWVWTDQAEQALRIAGSSEPA